MRAYFKKYGEAAMWLAALVALFFMNTEGPSLCVFKALGVEWCPGCGLGHSMHHALHLNFAAAIEEHILGIPAVMIILFQTFKLIYINKNYKAWNSKKF